MSSPGLRERKKQKTRWAIQEHAMRLFAQQGYDETTVEQIAAAAEISPSTFFRYFKTKEDVVVRDRYDDMIIEAVLAAPPDLTPVATVRQALLDVFGQSSAQEMDDALLRGRLTLAHPAIRARTLQNMLETTDDLAGALASRLGRPADDFRVRALAGACIGALIECVLRWMEHGEGGFAALSAMVAEALDVVEHGI
jgi:AcrR family transcriptional regulator